MIEDSSLLFQTRIRILIRCRLNLIILSQDGKNNLWLRKAEADLNKKWLRIKQQKLKLKNRSTKKRKNHSTTMIKMNYLWAIPLLKTNHFTMMFWLKVWLKTVRRHPSNSIKLLWIEMSSSTNNKMWKVSMKISMIISNQKVVSAAYKMIFHRMIYISSRNIKKYISLTFKFQRQICLLEEFNLNFPPMSVCRMILNWTKFHLLIKIRIKFNFKMNKIMKLVFSIKVNNYKRLLKNEEIQLILILKKRMKIKKKRKNLWRKMQFLKKNFKTSIWI